MSSMPTIWKLLSRLPERVACPYRGKHDCLQPYAASRCISDAPPSILMRTGPSAPRTRLLI